jgi:polynucleotide 5'-kinase involved in rRNA processing
MTVQAKAALVGVAFLRRWVRASRQTPLRGCADVVMPKSRRNTRRERPNILVTGTPGTGKTTLAAALAAATGLQHVDVGAAIREQSLHSGWDEEFQCHIVDEDKARVVRWTSHNSVAYT